ncbi:N-acetyltransferase [Aeromicrobium phragmitis]|uniref:N-acetyltransferase n=1 Tax=Aeromicrobium phragmitis TaxID=2478914 RepID=A0A3L8PLY9_9ACTN|nr:GNAT family N-acetyltransferase [Aeromicrobium phragmitis]RLV55763.1 N-acetyltransferase [Aeromicrobium phragmitis]
MDENPVIITDRLILRRFTLDDADFLFDLFSRAEVARWSGSGTPMDRREEAVERIRRQPARAGDHPACGVFAVEADSELVGMALLVPIPASAGHESEGEIEIGWHFHPDVWGNGYGTEAGRALVERGFAAGFPALYAVTDPDNVRSQAVCRRLGMTDLGLRDDWYDRSLRAFRLDRQDIAADQ